MVAEARGDLPSAWWKMKGRRKEADDTFSRENIEFGRFWPGFRKRGPNS